MWVLFAEAVGAVVVLCLIGWWTMVHGRSKGERKERPATDFQPTEKARPDL